MSSLCTKQLSKGQEQVREAYKWEQRIIGVGANGYKVTIGNARWHGPRAPEDCGVCTAPTPRQGDVPSAMNAPSD